MDKLAAVVDKFYKWAQQAASSTQPGDVYKAIFDSKVLGLTGPQSSQAEFDPNSKAGDIIFGLMDKFSYKGSVSISVVYTAKGLVDLPVASGNPKLSAAVKQAFLPSVSAVVKKLAPPASDIKLANIVTARNA